ncbi:NADH:ubiquinone reductase (Na(+)-transporting) subunit F [Tindallia californiensis]|uniref:Na+-transporting NADH:ubiquinone oxidoreductase subunit F n=1 Tax=Tindallia californiensis TaxID=159292 RepID=A0A1H3IGN0_9FIRM|nr:2Fe-2S iron-sulfur cluster binding domain-containing protein [Tindallia californiensis]SDY26409.1 Na+-transporting NADH:ubiquinone oxidoreductase subunit F [Tindallia californiensis]
MTQIMITVGIMSSLSGILALILTLANQYIANYGECNILINNDKEFIVEGGSTLLNTLNEQELFLPSACGGKGTCGLCKCGITEGGGPVLPTETSFLNEDDLKNNLRLSCQVKVKSDLKLTIPEDLLNARKYEAVVDSIKELTNTIRFLKIQISDGQQIDFTPGQYVQLLAPPYPGNPEEVFRAYSIASPASNHDYIELIIGYVEEGLVTTYVHQFLQEGDSVSFNGPFGDFYLQKESDADIVLIAVGTGLAPIRSILYQLKEENINRKTTFFFGAKTEKDLVLADEMKEFEEILPNFSYKPVLSRVAEEDPWDGDRGRVTDSIEKYIDNADNKEAYLCGSPVMIESAVKKLKEKGFTDENVFYDEFG